VGEEPIGSLSLNLNLRICRQIIMDRIWEMGWMSLITTTLKE